MTPATGGHRYPIAETFTSIQGEGIHTGVLMTFIRFAGCNVGRAPNGTEPFPVLKGHTVCETSTGEKFTCDTNYHVRESLTVQDIVARVDVNTVCFTGGEPFLQDIERLIAFLPAAVAVHVETSGTLPIRKQDRPLWVSCAPKRGFLSGNSEMVNEWKFLMPPDGDPVGFAAQVNAFLAINGKGQPVSIGVMNDIATQRDTSMACEVVKLVSGARLLVQLHKLIGAR